MKPLTLYWKGETIQLSPDDIHLWSEFLDLERYISRAKTPLFRQAAINRMQKIIELIKIK